MSDVFGPKQFHLTRSQRNLDGIILRRSSQGNRSVKELNTRGVGEYSDFGLIERAQKRCKI